MSKYVLTYHGGSGMPSSEEEAAQVMAAWGSWFGTLGAALVDGGNPVGATKTIAPDGSVSDGAVNGLTGYSLINADNLDGAVELAKGCPVLASGGTVAVAEAIDM